MADVSTYVPQFPMPPQGYDLRDQQELRSAMRAALTGVVVAIADLDSQIGAATPTELGDLTDVTLTSLGNGEVLLSSGGVFINQTLAEAGIAAAAHTHVEADITDLQAYLLDITGESLSDLSDVTITSIASGEILKWNGSAWINNTLAEAGISAVGHTHVEADITDLQAYLLDITGESLGDLSNVTDASSAAGWYLRSTAAGTWVAQSGLSEADVTAHQAALSITESQISDLDHYTSSDFATDLAAATIGGDQVDLDKIGTPGNSSVQVMQDIFHSSGLGSGGVVTVSLTADSVDIAAGEGWIRASDDPTTTLYAFGWGAATLSVPDNTTRYVGVEYNAGSPQAVVRTSNSFNGNSDFLVAVVVNDGTNIHIIENGAYVGDHAGMMIQRLRGTAYIAYDRLTGGLAISETGTRNLAFTAGKLWSGLSDFAVSALDTSVTGNWTTYYYNGSAWVAGTATQWPNTQYNNVASGLATMTNNWYANLYFYAAADDEFYMVYGQGQYSSAAQAQQEDPPSLLPEAVRRHSLLIGRLTFQKSGGTATDIQSYLGVAPSGSSAISDHGQLAGLTDDDHTQYILVDASRDFTATPAVNGTDVSLVGHTHVEADITDLGNYEDYLGLPASDGYILSSTAAGVRSWIANTATVAALNDIGDVTITTVANDEVLQYTGAGWENQTLAEAGISAVGHTHVEADITDLGAYLTDITGEPLSSLQDVTITTIASGEILKWNGTAWINNTLAEAGIAAATHVHAASDITSGTFADALVAQSNVTQHQAALSITESQISDLGTYFEAGDSPTWTGTHTFSNPINIGTGMDVGLTGALGYLDSAGSIELTIDSDNNSTANYLDIRTDGAPGAGTLLLRVDDSGQVNVAVGPLGVGAIGSEGLMFTDGAIPKIASDSILQYEVPTGSYHYFTVNNAAVATINAAGALTLGSSTTLDFKIHEPSAGQWYVEAQSTNDLNLKGTEVYIDDGGTNKGRAASVVQITSVTTAPSGDYPYGALWCIY